MTYILAGQHGLGRHTDTLEKSDHQEYLKLTFIQALVSSIGGMAFLKLSVGFSLLRLGVPTLYNRILWSLNGKSMVLRKANQPRLLSLDQHSSVSTHWYLGVNGLPYANLSPASGIRTSSQPACL